MPETELNLVDLFVQEDYDFFVCFTGTVGGGIDATAMIIAPYVKAEFTCTGPYNEFPPKWLLNGSGALRVGDCYNYTLNDTMDGNATATLIVYGNSTCETFNISCRIYKDSQYLYLHYTTLEIEGRLYHLATAYTIIGLTM